jgi:hypothetical protein
MSYANRNKELPKGLTIILAGIAAFVTVEKQTALLDCVTLFVNFDSRQTSLVFSTCPFAVMPSLRQTAIKNKNWLLTSLS